MLNDKKKKRDGVVTSFIYSSNALFSWKCKFYNFNTETSLDQAPYHIKTDSFISSEHENQNMRLEFVASPETEVPWSIQAKQKDRKRKYTIYSNYFLLVND